MAFITSIYVPSTRALYNNAVIRSHEHAFENRFDFQGKVENIAKKIFLKSSVCLALAGMLLVNYLANALPINEVTTGGVSDLYPNLFTPAGFTFSIWGFIYLLLLLFAFYQLSPLAELKQKGGADALRLYFVFTCIANISWIFAWHHFRILLSLVVIVILLVLLFRIAGILDRAELTKAGSVFLRVPFSVYFGWITVASIANLTVYMESIEWRGLQVPGDLWAAAAVLAGGAAAASRIILRRDMAYGLVFIWAYAGILARHLSHEGFGGAYNLVIAAAIAGIAAVPVSIAVSLRRVKTGTGVNIK